MRRARGKSKNNRASGQSLAELAAALVLMTPVLLITLDCLSIIIGCATNDAICRDAARAAASGPPGDTAVGDDRTVEAGDAPYKRASAIIKNIYQSHLPMKVRDAINVRETVRDCPPSSSGGSLDGDVSVETTIDIFPPFLVKFFVADSTVTLKSKHDVPYTYTVKYVAPAVVAGG